MLFIIVFFAGLIAHFLLPVWWVAAPIAFFAAFFFAKTNRTAFWTPFLANAALWLVLILVQSIPNNNMLAAKIAPVISMPHWTLLILSAVAIGGLLSGLSGLAGFWAKQWVDQRRNVIAV